VKSAVRLVRENIQRTLVPAFHDSGVRLVFNSHVHAFEQVDRNGITYIIDALGGASAYPLKTRESPDRYEPLKTRLGTAGSL
jgi:hypothetical protein